MVDIHEEIFPPETLGKSVVQPTGHGGRIVSAVIDEDLTSHDPARPMTIHIIARDERDYYCWLQWGIGKQWVGTD